MASIRYEHFYYRNRCLPMVGILALSLWVTSWASGQGPQRYASGSGSRADRQEAIAAIPFRSLTATAANRIHDVVSDTSVYRRLPVRSFECDRELFVFLVRNPEVVIEIWRLMGATDLSMTRTGEFTFNSADGAGTDSQIELVYGTPNFHLYFGTGAYEGPLFKRDIHGACVMLLRSDYQVNAGRPTVSCRLDVFLQIDRGAVDAIAKTIHPLFGKTADQNFVETTSFLQKLSQTAAENSDGMFHLSNRLVALQPQVRAHFSEVASGVAGRLSSATAAQQGPHVSRIRPASVNRENDERTRRASLVSRYPTDGPVYR